LAKPKSKPKSAADKAAPDTVPVLLPLALPAPYDYLVPKGLTVGPGQFVVVPLATSEYYGAVWTRPEGTETPEIPRKKLREIIEAVEDVPPLPPVSLAFADWVASYTLTPPGMVLRMMMSARRAFEPPAPRYGVRLAGPAPERLTPARARVLEAEANEDEMSRRLKRARELAARNFVSEEALVTAEAAHKRALAALASARSQAEQARATLEVDRTNLAKAVIRSPINGTVLARKVEPGQTVAATFQAPVLFTLAEDLTKMELHVDVDEADVGRVAAGQNATFAVDAYPGEEFPSTVTEVRNAAKTVSGVVTYETVLSVDNSQLLLRPGMTGTANITVKAVENALLVPNAALRFTPPAAAVERPLWSRILPSPPRRPAGKVQTGGDRRQQRVWTLREGEPVAIPVKVGASDGRVTQIVSGELAPGIEVIIGTVGGGT